MGKKMSLKERLAKKREDLKKSGGGYNYYLVKEGTNRFRILPVGDEKDFSIEATTFFLGKDLGLVISPVTFGQKCAIMKAYEKLKGSKNEEDRAIAKRLKPGRKFFAPAIPYKDEKGSELDMDSGPKLLIMAPGLCGKVIDLYLDEDEAGDFTDPIKGYDLKFRRTGKGKMDTEYDVTPCRPTKLPNKELRGQTFDPEEMLKKITPTYEQTKEYLEKFLSLPPEEEEETNKDSKKSNRDRKKKKRNRDL